MAVVVGRVIAWRRWGALAAALIAALVTMVAAGRTIKAREEEPRIRQIDYDASFQASAIMPNLARAASLWLDGNAFECRVAALYEDEQVRFSPVFKLAHESESEAVPTVVTLAAGWAANVLMTHSAQYEAA